MVTWRRGGKLHLPHEDRNTKKTCFLPNQKPRPTQACSSRTPPPALHQRKFYILNEPNHMEWNLQLRLQSVVIFDSRPPIALRGSLIRAAALQHTGGLTSELVPYTTSVCGRWCWPARLDTRHQTKRANARKQQHSVHSVRRTAANSSSFIGVRYAHAKITTQATPLGKRT